MPAGLAVRAEGRSCARISVKQEDITWPKRAYAALPVDDKRQLIDFVSLVVMPSFSALASTPTLPEQTYVGRSLVVGDPEVELFDKLVRPGMFERLPGAREEAIILLNKPLRLTPDNSVPF